jgi:DNA-binding CsgD family transcriptional regulator
LNSIGRNHGWRGLVGGKSACRAPRTCSRSSPGSTDSARERELVRLLLTGLDTRELATRMFISRYTVNDHLKSVFAKLGIHSRRELVTGLFGQTA